MDKGDERTRTSHGLPFPASAVLKLSTAPIRVRAALVSIAAIIYGGGAIGFYPWIGRAGIGLAVLPVLVVGVSFGLMPAAAVAVLSIPANLLMFLLAGDPHPAGLLGSNFWMSQAVFLLVGSVAGMMSDLWRRLHTELGMRRRTEAKLEYMARHDPLTGTFNRYSLDEILRREIARAVRHRRPIGFLMIDVNRFKEVNDRFGHAVGDRVLCGVARALRQSVRDSDVVVRFGGDEFLVLLIETDGETDIVRERIRSELSLNGQMSFTDEFPITLAIGTAHWDPATGEPIERVLNQADLAMYDQKRTTLAE